MSLRDWPWEHVLEVLRAYGPSIGDLARKGDPLARKLRARYQYAYDHPNDVDANMSLRDCLDEYLRRELNESERRELGARFGHLVDERPTGPRIVVPALIRRQ